MRRRAAKQEVQPDAMSDFRSRSKLWNKHSVCVIDSLQWNPLCCICCSLFLSAALHYELLLPTCLWHSLEATWTLSWMFCDHVLMKCYCLHSASGHHVKDKESEVFSYLSEDCGRFQLFFMTESVTLSLLLCPPSPTTPEPWSFPLFSVFKLISFICFLSTRPAFPHPLPLILILIETSLCLLLP